MPIPSDSPRTEIRNHPLAADGGSQPDQGGGTKNDKGLDGDTAPAATGTPTAENLEGGSSGDPGGGTKDTPEKSVGGE